MVNILWSSVLLTAEDEAETGRLGSLSAERVRGEQVAEVPGVWYGRCRSSTRDKLKLQDLVLSPFSPSIMSSEFSTLQG